MACDRCGAGLPISVAAAVARAVRSFDSWDKFTALCIFLLLLSTLFATLFHVSSGKPQEDRDAEKPIMMDDFGP